MKLSSQCKIYNTDGEKRDILINTFVSSKTKVNTG